MRSLLLALSCVMGLGCARDEPERSVLDQVPAPPKRELVAKDLAEGTGPEAKAGDRVAVHYTGRFQNGKEFDSSHRRGEPFVFQLGLGQVIAGWDQGVQGMKVGGKRRLEIPSHLAYGARGYPPLIPPDADLVFEVELLDIR